MRAVWIMGRNELGGARDTRTGRCYFRAVMLRYSEGSLGVGAHRLRDPSEYLRMTGGACRAFGISRCSARGRGARGASLLLRRKRQHVHGRCSAALAVAVLNRQVDQVLRLVDGVDEVQAVGQPRGDGGAEGASAAVGLFLWVRLGGELEELAAVEEDVHVLAAGFD